MTIPHWKGARHLQDRRLKYGVWSGCARMAGTPSLEKIKRFWAAHLPDGNAIRARPDGRAHEI